MLKFFPVLRQPIVKASNPRMELKWLDVTLYHRTEALLVQNSDAFSAAC